MRRAEESGKEEEHLEQQGKGVRGSSGVLRLFHTHPGQSENRFKENDKITNLKPAAVLRPMVVFPCCFGLG